jgi:hypothetical protein
LEWGGSKDLIASLALPGRIEQLNSLYVLAQGQRLAERMLLCNGTTISLKT